MTVGEILEALSPLDRTRVVYALGPHGPARIAALIEIQLTSLTETGVQKELGVCVLPLSSLHQVSVSRVEGET